MSKKRKINIVTLGCSKNVVDSEFLMKQLDSDGWEVVHDSDDTSAKVVVIKDLNGKERFVKGEKDV